MQRRKLGFEEMKAVGTVNMEEKTELNAYLHKLYMRDTHVNIQQGHKPVPAVASDFQDVLSNLTLAKTSGPEKGRQEHQLEVHVTMNKKTEETAVQLVYSDFRIVVAPPVVAGIMEATNLMTEQMGKITEILAVKTKTRPTEERPPESKVVRETPKPVSATKAVKFTGEIRNIEMWIPRNVKPSLSMTTQYRRR